MAMIEIDESEFHRLQRLSSTVAKIAGNPNAKLLLQQAHKTVDANALTPELDEQEKKKAADGEWQKKFETLQAEIQADREKRDSDKKLDALTAKFNEDRKALLGEGYTPQFIEALEKEMTEKGIPSHEIALAWYLKKNPPPEIAAPRGFGSFDFTAPPKEEETFIKELFMSKGDNDTAVLKAAGEAIADVRQHAPARR